MWALLFPHATKLPVLHNELKRSAQGFVVQRWGGVLVFTLHMVEFIHQFQTTVCGKHFSRELWGFIKGLASCALYPAVSQPDILHHLQKRRRPAQKIQQEYSMDTPSVCVETANVMYRRLTRLTTPHHHTRAMDFLAFN